MLIKSTFSRSILNREHINKSRLRKRQRGIRQSRYWEHAIRDDQNMQQHINYIHDNPVKHGHVKNPTDWPHSTIHHYIKTTSIEPNWGYDINSIEINTGEPK